MPLICVAQITESMRRKVLQHFANTPPQRLLDLPSGFDLARFARLETGTLDIDYLEGTCRHNRMQVAAFDMCGEHRAWLDREVMRNRITKEGLAQVAMTVIFRVRDIKVERSYGVLFRSGIFCFDCRSEVRTDEKTYVSVQAGEKEWSYDYYWEKLYGPAEPLSPSRGDSL
jgi:hypothetical protein